MNQTTGKRRTARGVVLVASRSTLFADVVGGLVSASGFAPAYEAEFEPAQISITRTQPCLVICDCGGLADGVQRLVDEASQRDVPMLLSRSDAASEFAPIFGVAQRVAWFTFPVTRAEFQAAMDALVQAVTASTRRMTARLFGVSVDAAFTVLTFPSEHGS